MGFCEVVHEVDSLSPFGKLIRPKIYLAFRLLLVRSPNSWSRSGAFMSFSVTHSLYSSDQPFHLTR